MIINLTNPVALDSNPAWRHVVSKLAIPLVLAVLMQFPQSTCLGSVTHHSSIDKQIEMLPLILVASDQTGPTERQATGWIRHLTWTQRYFAERLDGDTFELAAEKATVIKLQRPLSFYQNLKKGDAAFYLTAELLAHFQVNRFDCPYTFCCLVMNPKERWPIGGGRTINGGINRGGGMLVISSFALDRIPNFQSTLRHEIAHTVGLPHVDVYGYDMKTNRSVMAYNTKHRTNGFRESSLPARLIPEDMRALALADRVFPKTRFNVQTDVPSSYKLHPRVISLPAMKLPGHPDYDPKFSTTSGEDSGSKIALLNQRVILPSIGPGVTFDKQNMWASKKQPDGKIVVDVEFPFDVKLNGLVVHSEHSGRYNKAESVVVASVSGTETRFVYESKLPAADAEIKFAAATSQRWRLTLQAGQSGKVCLRGLQFLNGQTRVFPPPVPFRWEETAAR